MIYVSTTGSSEGECSRTVRMTSARKVAVTKSVLAMRSPWDSEGAIQAATMEPYHWR